MHYNYRIAIILLLNNDKYHRFKDRKKYYSFLNIDRGIVEETIYQNYANVKLLSILMCLKSEKKRFL